MGKKNVQTHHHHHHRHHHLCFYRSRHLMMSLSLLLLSCLIQVRYLAEGRAVTGLARTDPKRDAVVVEDRAKEAVEQSAIGSSPPSCDRRCRSCIRCMAVQVPVAPQIRSHSVRNVAYYARGDDISNYKPMTWKCKCGDYFFNP